MTAFPISIERMVVRADRLVCDVVVDRCVSRFTTPKLISRVCASFPDIPRHACVNERGDTFSCVMESTSLPHLLEHLVIDLQTHAAGTGDAVFVGTTTWTDEGGGQARIEVNFTDDLVALRAFRDAVHFLNGIVVI